MLEWERRLSHSNYLAESVAPHVYLGSRTLLALQILAVISIGMDLLTSLSNHNVTEGRCVVSASLLTAKAPANGVLDLASTTLEL